MHHIVPVLELDLVLTLGIFFLDFQTQPQIVSHTLHLRQLLSAENDLSLSLSLSLTHTHTHFLGKVHSRYVSTEVGLTVQLHLLVNCIRKNHQIAALEQMLSPAFSALSISFLNDLRIKKKRIMIFSSGHNAGKAYKAIRP